MTETVSRPGTPTINLRPDIGVVGKGVVGLQTGIEALKKGHGVNIYEFQHHDPQLVQFPERQRVSSASEAGVAQWLPFVEENGITKQEQLEQIKWIEDSFRFYTDQQVAEKYKGAMMRRENTELMRHEEPMPEYLRGLLEQLGPVKEFGIPSNPLEYKYGWDFTTLAFNTPDMLQRLQEQFKELGGNVISRRIQDKDDLYKLPETFLVNCMGLKARDIFPNLDLKAVKGHLLFLDNPGVDNIVSADDLIMLPRSADRLVLGTLFIHEGKFDSAEPTREEREDVWARMNGLLSIDVDVFKDLQGKLSEDQIVGETTGLRPYREKGTLVAAETGAGKKVVVHNVGHGGMGWTIAPGTAKAAVGLIDRST